jgi:putative thiamine transport system permease protein
MDRALRALRPALLRAGPAALVPLVVQVVLIGSVALGLLFLVLPAFGYLPALGRREFDLAPLRAVLAYPGLGSAIASTALSGVLSTLVALLLALGLIAVLDPLGLGERQGGRWLRRAMLALIAAPHIAVAIGLAFLLTPSGWLLRAVAQVVAIDRPPDYLLVNDRAGLVLALALTIKETPFILAVAFGALHRLDGAAQLRVCRTLGYGAATAWVKIILPQLYRLIRLPVFAVLAYGLSVADMAIVLGPGLPPTLPVLILRLVADPDLANRLTAAGAGLLQIALVLTAFLAWRGAESLAAKLIHAGVTQGRRDLPAALAMIVRLLILAAGAIVLLLGLTAIAGIAVWSIAEVWRFPDLLPARLSFETWGRVLAGLERPLLTSLGLAFAASGIAVAAAIACLELEDRIGSAAGRRGQWILFLPLFAPEMGFLFGLQIAAGGLGLTGTVAAVLWFQLLFVFPYVFLSLSDPWRALDARYARTARCLGAGRWRVLLCVKAPLLKAPLALSLAVGLAVSLTLYLPTVLAGAGRITTLATETVALYGGGDRRVLGVYAVVQAGLAAAIFGAAVLAGRKRRFHRAGTQP